MSNICNVVRDKQDDYVTRLQLFIVDFCRKPWLFITQQNTCSLTYTILTTCLHIKNIKILNILLSYDIILLQVYHYHTQTLYLPFSNWQYFQTWPFTITNCFAYSITDSRYFNVLVDNLKLLLLQHKYDGIAPWKLELSNFASVSISSSLNHQSSFVIFVSVSISVLQVFSIHQRM